MQGSLFGLPEGRHHIWKPCLPPTVSYCSPEAGLFLGIVPSPGKSYLLKLYVAGQQVWVINFQLVFLEPDPQSTRHPAPEVGYFSNGPILQVRKLRPTLRHLSKASKGARIRNSELKAQLSRLPHLYHTRTWHEATLLDLRDRCEHSYPPSSSYRERRSKDKRDKVMREADEKQRK